MPIRQTDSIWQNTPLPANLSRKATCNCLIRSECLSWWTSVVPSLKMESITTSTDWCRRVRRVTILLWHALRHALC